MCAGQLKTNTVNGDVIKKVLAEPTSDEISNVLAEMRRLDLKPKDITIHDTLTLTNSNQLFVISHTVEGQKHYGAIIIPQTTTKKLPVIILATGGDGMHKEFDITQDFNHAAIHFPAFLGGTLDKQFIVVIPSFRGQQLIIGDAKYQSEGDVSDAFGGATTDALALLNVALKSFRQADEARVAILGGSRGGAVALLASVRDKRIKRVIAVAAPTDMKALYELYPQQFKILFFNDLLSGKITEGEARKKFISISPIHFTKELPLVQLHHDSNDPFVPISFARKLEDRIKANGKEIDLHVYDEGIHGYWSDEKYWTSVETFLTSLSD
jgi:dipeptidyl aminopeptidase/acylaminoacyl peptidase